MTRPNSRTGEIVSLAAVERPAADFAAPAEIDAGDLAPKEIIGRLALLRRAHDACVDLAYQATQTLAALNRAIGDLQNVAREVAYTPPSQQPPSPRSPLRATAARGPYQRRAPKDDLEGGEAAR